jgi:undecaprenyl diphosphate synthase
LKLNPENLSEKSLMEGIDRTRLPAHTAVIMDGNGRWAGRKGLPRAEGHRKGVEVIREIIEAADDLGIKVLTLYAFSTENWKRPKKEVFALMQLLRHYLRKETGRLNGKNVSIRAIGDLSGIPPSAKRELLKSIEATSANSGLILNLAVNYGARSEIIEGVKKMLRDAKEGCLEPETLTREKFENYLYTAGLPDPDLLIRTGNEFRVSNFLLWQIAYTEFWVTPLCWPEFKKADFYAAVADYQRRKRRFGGLK